MPVQSLVLGRVVFLAGVPRLVSSRGAGGCAAMSGLTARHDKAGEPHVADVIAVGGVPGLSRITNEYALHAFIVVFAASLAQTLFTRLVGIGSSPTCLSAGLCRGGDALPWPP